MKNICIFIDVPYGVGGTFQYNQQILSALLSLPNHFQVTVFYVDDAWLKFIPNSVRKIRLPYPKALKRFFKVLFGIGFPYKILRLLFFLTPLRRLADPSHHLVFFPSQDLAGLFLSKNSVNVVHDLMHRYEKRFRESSSFGRSKFRDRLFSSMCIYSRLVLVDSSVGKQQLVESYSASPKKIEILPYIAPLHIAQYRDEEHSDYFSKLKLPPAFIFYPAQFWPHKNHIILLEAAAILKNSLPDFHLLFTGPKKYAYKELVSYCEGNNLQNHVTFFEYVPNEVIGGFYRRARAFVMPTFYGPTNIPPLEAIALRCPAAVSKIYGMPEQLGDAALYFDNTNLQEVTDVLRNLWTDETLREQLMKNCEKHFSNWNQEKFNQRVLEIIERVVT